MENTVVSKKTKSIVRCSDPDTRSLSYGDFTLDTLVSMSASTKAITLGLYVYMYETCVVPWSCVKESSKRKHSTCFSTSISSPTVHVENAALPLIEIAQIKQSRRRKRKPNHIMAATRDRSRECAIR